MTKEAPFVLFTDLDGTLLDIATYSWELAGDALRALQASSVPVIFCSSKTRAEQVFYREAMGIADPFVTENGSAIFWSDNNQAPITNGEPAGGGMRRHVLGRKVDYVRRNLKKCCRELGLGCRCYADFDLDAVADITGLDPESAARAMRREFSETVLEARVPVVDPQFDRLSELLAKHGLRGVRGSKFYTVTGLAADKGSAVALLAGAYRDRSPGITTVGIGDGENDAPMLAAVDRAFLVQRPDATWANLPVPGLTRVEGVGPVGWSTIAELLLAD